MAGRGLLLVALVLLAAGWFLFGRPGTPRGTALTRADEIASPSDQEPQPILEPRTQPESRAQPEQGDPPAIDEARPLPAVPDEGSAAAVFWGRIVAADDGFPISGATVTPERGGEARRTGVDGLFELPVDADRTDGFSSLSVNASVFEIEAPGFGPVRIAPMLGHETPGTAREIRLARAASLAATVLDASGAPIAGARVRLSAKAYELAGMNGTSFLRGREWKREGTTGADGTCLVVELPPEVPIEVIVAAEGYSFHREPSPLVLAPGEEARRAWRLGGGTLVRGQLLDEAGAAVAGQTIWLSREGIAGTAADRPAYFYSGDEGSVVRQARTGDDGRFEMKDVTPGAWWIGPGAGRGSGTPVEGRISPLADVLLIEPDESVREVVLRAYRGLTIRGTVLGHDGQPAPRTSVSAVSVDVRGGFFTANSDDQGAFVLGPLAPGSFEIHAGGGDRGPSEPLTAQAGETNLIVRLTRAFGLSLRAVRADGGEGVGAVFRLWGPHPTGGFRVTVGASGIGTDPLEMRGLAAGSYDATAATENGLIGVVRNIEVGAGSEGEVVEIPVEQGATLKVLYEGTQRYASFRIYYGETCVAGDGLRSGTSSVQVVPVGRLRVEISSGEDLAGEQWIDTAPGEQHLVTFRSE